MNCFKALATLIICTAIAIGTGGCTKSNEKTLSAKTDGQSGINCKLVLVDAGEGTVRYKLTIKYNDLNQYSERLREKLHEEAKRKFSVYENLKKYCEESKIKSICASLDMVLTETQITTLEIPYDIELYNRANNKLSDISHSISYDINQKDFLKGDSIQIDNQLKMGRATFDEISYMIVKNSL